MLCFRYADKLLARSLHGVGQESWREMCGQLLEPGCCDFVLAVDDPSAATAYSDFRAHMLKIDSSATIIRLSPNNLRVDEDGLGQISAAVRAGSDATVFRFLRGSPPEYLALLASIAEVPVPLSVRAAYIPATVGRGLRNLSVAAPAGCHWHLDSVMKLLHLLFPVAKMCATPMPEHWIIPAAVGKVRHLARMLELARAKVLTTRQCEEASKQFDRRTTTLITGNLNQFKCLVLGLRGLCGVVSVGGTSRGRVEAGAGFILARPDDSVMPVVKESLTVEGVFTKEDEVLLAELFNCCVKVALPRKKLVLTDALTANDKLLIQADQKYTTGLALPGNVWYDGQTYVDISGTRSLLRPDIEVVVDKFLADENHRIHVYNAQLEGF